MTRKFPLYALLVAVMTALMGSCNSSDDEVVIEGDYSNASVTSFNLKANTKVLNNLDSVFFSIDLSRGEIFNADSLPVGTKINRLLVNIGTPTISGCEITFRPSGATSDTTVNYLTNPGDSIDFSTGPAKLKITSYNGSVSREYTIKVNVHKTEPDSLTWGKVAYRSLPSLFTTVDAQHTVDYNGGALCMTTSAGDVSVATVADDESDWTIGRGTLPGGAMLSSLRAVGEKLYVIDTNGSLYESSDKAATWRSTGAVMNHLYGAYDGKLLGARRDAGIWKQVTWPATTEKELPDGCPVAGTSELINYTTEWSTSPMAIMVGGVDASGKLTGATWGYDGGVWAKVSQKDMTAAQGITLLPYFAYRVNKAGWRVTRRTALIAIGGREVSGAPRRSLYLSYDRGLNWNLSDTLLCMPPYIPAFYDAQAVVMSTMKSIYDDKEADTQVDEAWTSCPAPRIPAWYRLAASVEADSRVSEAITEWECPYIYLFGGVTPQGVTSNTVWRGVINRLTFRPLY